MSVVIDTLRASTVSEELGPAELEILASLFEERSYTKGDIISSPEDNNSNKLFILASGDIDVKIDAKNEKQTALHILKPGDLANIISFVGAPELFATTLSSVDTTTVLCLERARLESLINSHPMIVYKFMRGVVRNVHGIARRMNLQSSELSNYIYRTEGRY